MTDAQLSALLDELLALDDETEWVEFKHNIANPQEIGEYVSALANSSLRQRFGIKPESASQASRIIRLAVKDGVIKLHESDVRDRDRSYVPFWASFKLTVC